MAFKKVWFKNGEKKAYIYVDQKRISDFKPKLWDKTLKFEEEIWDIDCIEDEIYENPEGETEKFIVT